MDRFRPYLDRLVVGLVVVAAVVVVAVLVALWDAL